MTGTRVTEKRRGVGCLDAEFVGEVPEPVPGG